MAWDVALTDDDQGTEEHYVIKTNKIKASSSELDKNTRDALIMERAGRAPNSYESNVLTMYQYCANSALVPFASKQTLYKYIQSGRRVGAFEMYHLALQAARGLYQMQSYKNGKSTCVHGDVTAQQLLLFDPPQDNEEDDIPLLQLSDFNRGKVLKRSVKTKEPCAFRTCGVEHQVSTFRSPEEYMKCADQSADIDVFALGSAFFFLSSGMRPFFEDHFPYKDAKRNILDGIHPQLPDGYDYRSR